jgi:hypothetical protein
MVVKKHRAADPTRHRRRKIKNSMNKSHYSAIALEDQIFYGYRFGAD